MMDTSSMSLLERRANSGSLVSSLRRAGSMRASLRMVRDRWRAPNHTAAASSPADSRSAAGEGEAEGGLRLAALPLPAAQKLVLPNRSLASPCRARAGKVKRLQSVPLREQNLPATPEYCRRLAAAVSPPIATPVISGAYLALARKRRSPTTTASAPAVATAPALPPRPRSRHDSSPPPVPPRRKSTRLTTTSVSTYQQQLKKQADTHEYENLESFAGPKAELVQPNLARPPSPARPETVRYCRAPCMLKVMSLMDSNMKHTCVPPPLDAPHYRPLPAAVPRAFPSLGRAAEPQPQQPCVAPCPLKLTSMLQGGPKHVCVLPGSQGRLARRRSVSAPATPVKEDARSTREQPETAVSVHESLLSTDDTPRVPDGSSFLDGEVVPCCQLTGEVFPHLAEDCIPSVASPAPSTQMAGVSPASTTTLSLSSVSPRSISSADNILIGHINYSKKPTMRRSSSSGALHPGPGPSSRAAAIAKRRPSSASTSSASTSSRKSRRSLRWPSSASSSGSSHKLQELGKHRHRGAGGGGRLGGGGSDLTGEGVEGGGGGGTGMEFLVDGLHLTRTHQKKKVPTTLDKLQHIDIHSHALFAAVEQGHVERARTILQSTDVDINSVSSDGLSPLDVAALAGSNSKQMAKLLLAFGAQEGNQFKNPESLGIHLKQLVLEAELRLQELGGGGLGGGAVAGVGAGTGSYLLFNNLHNAGSGPGAGAGHTRSASVGGGGMVLGANGSVPPSCFATPSVSVSAADTVSVTSTSSTSSGDKQLSIWDRRVKSLKRMLLGFEQAKPPDEPFLVAVDVTGTNSVTVRFQEPETLDSHICTKFKVEWSSSADFSTLAGGREVLDLTHSECHIADLVQGQRYYFRVACGNLRGFSNFVPSNPPSVIPSSWRDVDGREARFTGVSLRVLDSLFTEMRKARPEFAAEIKDIQESSSLGGETPSVQRRKKTTIKQLFTAASKFQKNLRRGVYLSCLLYHEDRVLVTNEDFLPVIEVDETYPSCIYNDFHWLMKVACTWDDVKSLRQDMEKSLNSSSIHFRIKLLQAAAQMQTALCIQDLGQLYHKPIRDSQGTLVISMVNYVKNPKSVSVLNSRWLPIGKVVKKASNHDDPNVGEMLMSSIQEQILYHQVSSIRLVRGLYLGYLKMHSSVDLIQVVVPSKTPNVLPHCKIRDNPHVSAEEWEGLKNLRGKISATTATQPEKDSPDDQNGSSSSLEELASNSLQSEQQRVFVDLVASTARRLFSYMEISPEESQLHRLYDVEVVDLTPEVSFLVAVPPAESACAVPGQRDMLLQRGDLLSLPVQVFEMVHLASYQHNVISRYSRLSCILELDMLLAQHSLREAFSTAEVAQAKERLWKLQEIDSQLSAVKKGIRWLMDLVTFTRDRGSQPFTGPPGIPMRTLLAIGAPSKGKDGMVKQASFLPGGSVGVKRSLLQLPPRDPKLVKSSASRGSWPGPGVSGAPCLLATEFSKSEQQLNTSRNTASTTTIASPSTAKAASATIASATAISLSPSLPPTPAAIAAPMNSGTPRKGSAGSVGSGGISVAAASPSHSIGSLCSAALGGTSATSSPKGLPNSRSEDTLLLSSQRLHSLSHQRSRSSVLTASVSASTSPLLSVRSSAHSGVPVPPSVGSLMSVGGVSTNSGVSSGSGLSGNVVAMTDSQHSLSSEDSSLMNINSNVTKGPGDDDDEEGGAGSVIVPIPSSGILQVYAAYKTGLASGTSLKVHVTPQTSAREVVDLVVKQLNLAAVLKGRGGPVYSEDCLENFCLVAVIGARERCLRDDFKPLQLQNPWRKGRLYVRQKHDVLAALDQCARRPTTFL